MRLIVGGKDKFLFVIDRDLLGGFGNAAAVQTINFGNAIFATGAYWNSTFYLGGLNGAMQALSLNTTTGQFAVSSQTTHTYGFARATPSISASGSTQNGVVWSLDTGGYCTRQSKSCGPVVLYAHDSTNLKTELWNSALNANDAAGFAIKFSVPTVANGKVYVPSRGDNIGVNNGSSTVPGELDIYGLRP